MDSHLRSSRIALLTSLITCWDTRWMHRAAPKHTRLTNCSEAREEMKRGSGDPASRKAIKKARYRQSKGQQQQQQAGAVHIKLSEDHRGFLVVCDPGTEARAGKEASGILEDLIDAVCPAAGNDGTSGPDAHDAGADEAASSTDAPAADALEAELAGLRGTRAAKARRVLWHDTGCRGLRFFELKGVPADPCDIIRPLFQRVVETRQVDSRFLHRIMPVQRTCYADSETILRHVRPMIEAAFPRDPAPDAVRSFAIRFQHRLNNQVKRDDLLRDIAAIVPPGHPVQLTDPAMEIHVEVFKGVACLAVCAAVPGVRRFSLRGKAIDDDAAAMATRALQRNEQGKPDASETARAGEGAVTGNEEAASIETQ